MKKAYILGLFALALGFAACDDVEDAPGKPQTNPQEVIIPATGFDVSVIDLGAAPIDLKALSAKDEPVAFAEVTAVPGEWNDAYELVPRVYMAKDDSYENAVVINGAYKEGKLTVTPTQLQEALVSIYGLNPIVRTPYVRTAIYGVNGRSEVRIGGSDVYFAAEQLNLQQAEETWVDSKYYLVLAGADGKPDTANAIELNHEGDNQYDYPEFDTLIDITVANQQWWVVPASTLDGSMDMWYGAAVIKDDDGNVKVSLSGDLKEGQAGSVTAGTFAAESAYRFSVNMVDRTYSITYAYENIYMVTKIKAWSNKPGFVESYCMHRDDSYTHYRGYGVVKADYRFMTSAVYNEKGSRQIGATPDADNAFAGTLTMGGTDVAHASGLVFIDANLVDMTFTTSELTSVGIVGQFQDWNPGNCVEMKSTVNGIYTAEVTLPDGVDAGWKFVFNKDWNVNDVDISLAGSMDDLQIGSQTNLTFPAPGTYTVTLDLSKYPYTATCVAK